MATTTITAGKQSFASSGTQAAWDQARDATNSSTSATYTSATDKTDAINILYNAGRAGEVWNVNRAFFYFDLSSISGTITAMDLEIYGVTNNGLNVIVVASTAFNGDGSSNYADDEFNSWSPDSPTDYSSAVGWSVSTYNIITLNSTAISYANTNNQLICAVVDKDYDYDNVDPQFLGNVDLSNGIRYANGSQPLQLDITFTPSGYGNSVNGVTSANIGKVDGIATANISKVIGV